MNWGKKQSGINHYCCWCRKDIPENTPVYGLTAQFRKDVESPSVKKVDSAKLDVLNNIYPCVFS